MTQSGPPENEAVSRPSNADGFPIRFGKYVLLRKLATGGMAEIFLALHRSVAGFEKLIVIKRILPSMNSDPGFIEMLLREARIAATLSHPNVVQVFDVGHVDDTYYIAMEHIHGEDLRSIFRQMKRLNFLEFPMEHAIAILIETCAGLSYAHEKRALDGTALHIVHRDISPQNVILTFGGDVKIVDFGIAQSGRQMGDDTKSGRLKGKVPYMSPEQARGEELDWRSDIFAAGVILFELTTGRRLFKGQNELETLKLVCDRDYPLPSSVCPGYPKRLETIVMRALEKDRNDRYQSAREMQADLESYVRDDRITVSAIDMSRWMHALFADRLAEQKEDLQDVKQLADSFALQSVLSAGASDTADGQSHTGRSSPGPSIVSSTNEIERSAPGRSPAFFGIAIAIAVVLAFAITFRVVRTTQQQQASPNSSSPTLAVSRNDHVGSLRFETEPAQAAIWINGSLRAETTPSTIDRLPLGVPIEIKLSKEGYGAVQKTIRLSEERPSDTLMTALPKATVTLNVSTNALSPTFYIDGKPVVGPKIEGISPNETHRITIAANGYLARSMNFLGGPNDSKSVTLDLDKDDGTKKGAKPEEPPTPPVSAKTGSGKLNVGSRGGFCTVSVDGAPHGVTPVGGILLSAGSHRVVCRSESGKTQSESVTIEPDQTSRVSFSIGE